MRTLIENGWILTMDEAMHEYRNGHIVIEDDVIVYVGAPKEHERLDKVIDAKGTLVMPGMINTHSHMGMIPFRSLADDVPDRLRRFLFPLEHECMNESLAYLSTKYAALEMLQSGITTCTDMYYYMDQIALACEECGIRALLGETIIQQETCETKTAQEALALAEHFIETWKDSRLITPIIAPHATNTNDADIFSAAMEIAVRHDTMLTTHAAEMDYEMTYFQNTYHMSPIAWLDHIHCLNEHTLLAHCIHVSEDDCSLMKRRSASVAHCPVSNMKAGKGIAPVRDMERYGIAVGLGTDGASSGNTLDLFASMHIFALAQKTKYHDRALYPAKQIVHLATLGGAKALHLDHAIGSLEVGKKADVIVIECESPAMFPLHDPYSALVYGAGAHDVRDVFVDGVHVVNHHQSHIRLRDVREELDAEMQGFYEAAQRILAQI